MPETDHDPQQLIIVRHGQSAGNVARDLAHEASQDRIALEVRDADVPLSRLGEEQAASLGRWFASHDAEQRPEIILSSPYLRARETARLFRAAGGAPADAPICIDERLREKEFGILDGLTTVGVANLFPEQAAFRQTLGKFYHRPPGGESWCDVIFRLRSVMNSLSISYPGRRIIIFSHQVVVLCMRYILERMDEAAILAIDRQEDVANCAITDYRLEGTGDARGLVLQRYNVTAPMEEDHTAVTSSPDAIVGVRG